mgnify:FL=1
MRHSKRTFKQILIHLERDNRNTLMRKAHVANRVAKSVRGVPKKRSYDIKIKALQALVRKFARDVQIQEDIRTPDMVLVSLSGARLDLHAPKVCFDFL